MLSRLAKQTVLGQRKLPLFIYQSSASSGSDAKVSTETNVPNDLQFCTVELYRTEKDLEVKDISKAAVTELSDNVPRPTPFEGPLRDHVNFPKLTRPTDPAKTRLGFVPEEWFRFMYPKLGVTGPYTLGIGVSLFLMSKEIWLVHDFEFQHFIAFWMWVYVIIKTPLGEKLRDWANYGDKEVDEHFNKFRTDNEAMRLEAIAHEKEEQWRAEGKHLLFDAKKENVGLQLEASYRQSVMDLYQQVKKRLDYQVEVAKIDERIKQEFMVKWVIDRVNESISQTSEKDNLKQCIANLNVLAAKV